MLLFTAPRATAAVAIRVLRREGRRMWCTTSLDSIFDFDFDSIAFVFCFVCLLFGFVLVDLAARHFVSGARAGSGSESNRIDCSRSGKHPFRSLRCLMFAVVCSLIS